MGEYMMQGVRLEWQNRKGEHQSMFGQFFDEHATLFQRLQLHPGDMISVSLVSKVTERNGFLNTLIEFRNPQRVSDVDVAEGLCAEDV